MAKAIKVENISKAYQLGSFGTGTISHDLERFWARMRGKEDPFLKIGEVNDRTKKGNSDIVWSLKDLNFEIEQGDAVGIIGRNGAGKSTLLKILSRVTSPTTGSIKIKGRVSSLLEVGTGFHPELSGRENIYLNGTILGMRKAEITRKFDEIVDFAGVERYIDTPVKRYSSGMYVRLAFAVAAHLESEILIVDEVLSVGDAEFQKKCLGKMGEVSKGEGRTVLFVSHNIGAIISLCNHGILLENGRLSAFGEVNMVANKYLKSDIGCNKYIAILPDNQSAISDILQLNSIRLNKSEQNDYSPDIIFLNSSVNIQIDLELCTNNYNLSIGIEIFNIAQICIFKLASLTFNIAGSYKAICAIPPNLLNDDIYTVDIYIIKNRSIILLELKNALQFEVKEFARDDDWFSKWIGIIRPRIPIIIEKL